MYKRQEYIPDAGCDTVTIDNEQAAYDAVEELISLGHRRIAFAGSKKPYTSAILREKGYRRALEHAGLRIEESLIIKGDYSFVSGGEMFEQLMAQEQPPTAIFTIADSIAIGMLRASYQNEKFQKNPVAISGFDDTSLAQIYVPALSTVAQPRREIEMCIRDRLVTYARKNRLNINRVGITTSKKIGNAVSRNRARRIIREMCIRDRP